MLKSWKLLMRAETKIKTKNTVSAPLLSKTEDSFKKSMSEKPNKIRAIGGKNASRQQSCWVVNIFNSDAETKLLSYIILKWCVTFRWRNSCSTTTSWFCSHRTNLDRHSYRLELSEGDTNETFLPTCAFISHTVHKKQEISLQVCLPIYTHFAKKDRRKKFFL